MKNLLQNKYVLIGLTLVIGALIGWVIKPSSKESYPEDEHNLTLNEEGVWTCSMHPQIRQNEPGSCPLCGMDLIPVEAEADMSDAMAVSMSPMAMQLANVMTKVVGFGKASKTIRLNGKVMENEQRVYTQSSHIPGRIESLTVDFTGEYVQKGQTIATIYSPELVTAQQELFEAQKIKATQPDLFEAVRKKLLNWKLTNAQIDQILTNGKPIETLPIRAEKSGYVKDKKVNLGDYIKQGMPIYALVDLSKVWAMFEVYESDMQWIKKGATIDFTISSLPSENFSGKIAYIDPVINPKTRVSMVRVELNNPKNQLKPEMFASGILQTGSSSKEEIIIPKSAVMWTGSRSVVYVKQASDQGTHFKMREVNLGASLGASFIIKNGLVVGEEIAVNGTFSIDAAAQLAGKPSMMSPEGGAPMTGHNHGDMNQTSNVTEEMTISVDENFTKQLKGVYSAQLVMQEGFIATDSKAVTVAVEKVEASLKKVNMSLVKDEMHDHWMTSLGQLNKTLGAIKSTDDIEAQRLAYSDFNDALYSAIKMFGISGETVYYQFCPMARNDEGAYWLSSTKEIVNPYFGDAMLTCGENKEIIN